MAWVVLVLSGCMEAVWASALAASEGFSKLVPSVVFFVALAASMSGLAWALREIPVGTGYTVWVGLGAVLTVVWAVISGEETVTVTKALFLGLIIAGVVGLKLSSH